MPHTAVLPHDLDDALEIWQVVAAHVENFKALVVLERFLDECHRLVDPLDVDKGQLL